MTINKFPSISIVGATGAVGKICLDILSERKFPSDKINIFASKKSEGKKISYLNKDLIVREAKKILSKIQILFLFLQIVK